MISITAVGNTYKLNREKIKKVLELNNIQYKKAA